MTRLNSKSTLLRPVSKELPQSFFNRSADKVARELLGCLLCVKKDGRVSKLAITETESYMGPHDRASHAFKGRTKRTEVMYGAPGTIYIYLIYGIYDMLNIVTGEKDYPAAVLIRAAGEYDGPGKLTQALNITRAFNGKTLEKRTGLWIEYPPEKNRARRVQTIEKTPRVGVTYAKEWANKPLRFILKKRK